MEISQYLAQLLYGNDIVEIPRFGFFTCEYVSAEIHPVEHSFKPAYKKIDFEIDKAIKGELLIHTMVSDGLSVSASNAAITEFTKKIIRTLKSEKKFEFEGIGHLLLQSSAIVFEQDNTVNYFKGSLGLESFTEKPMLSSTKVISPKFAKKEEEKKSRKGLWWTIAAVFLLIILSTALVWKWDYVDDYWAMISSDDSEQVEEIKDKEIEQIPEIIIAEEVQKEDSLVEVNDSLESISTIPNDTLIEEPIPETPDVEEVVPEETPQKVSNVLNGRLYQDKKYFLVAGCFKDKVRADEFLQELSNDGFRASKEGKTSGGLYRVVYGGYDTWALAKADILKVKEKGRSGAWIQKNR